MDNKTLNTFYQRYYQTEKGLELAKGHRGFKSPFLNLLLEIRTQFSIVGKRQRFFKKILKNKCNLILDLGCGGGHELFIKYGEVIGTDLALGPLKNAKCIYPSVVCADINNLPFKKDAFDYVLSCDVIEHIPLIQKDRLISEIYRVLKIGGKTAHAIETEANNFLYRFAQKYPLSFQKSFVEETGGHFGLELPQDVLGRFARYNLKLIKREKIWGFVWSTEEYIYRFDNAYKNKSILIKGLVSICKVLNKNIILHAISNVLLGMLNYFIEGLTPLNHAQGILVAYKKYVKTIAT